MELTQPMPFAEAVARLKGKTAIASHLTTAQWQELPLALRDRAFFSAGVANLRAVAELQDKIAEALDLSSRDQGKAFMDRSRFVAEMRQSLGAEPGDSEQLTDITSRKRLELIYDFQQQDAVEYGSWIAGQDPDILDAFPAQELIRVEDREVPRDWAERWAAAGGRFYDGRMIAPKDDPVWTKISRFGRPWPPFDFGSGMGVEDIGRDEAEELGVIPRGASIAPMKDGFNAGLSATLPMASPAILEGFREIFGDQVKVSQDASGAQVIDWKGARR